MSRPDTSILMPLADIDPEDDVGIKIRTVGFLLSFNSKTSVGILSQGNAGLYIDMRLALKSVPGALPLKSKVMVYGTLEAPNADQPLASLQKIEDSRASSKVVLAALNLQLVDHLDIALWERSAREYSRALHHRHFLALEARRKQDG